MKGGLRRLSYLAAIGLGLATLLSFRILAAYPHFTEAFYTHGLGHFFPLALSGLTSIVPFSLAEWLVAGLVVRQIVGAAKGWARVHDRRWKLREALGAGALRLGADMGVVVALFYLFWGFHYADLQLESRQGWDVGGTGISELTQLAQEMVDAANAEYVLLEAAQTQASPTGMVVERKMLMEQLESGWREVAAMTNRPRLAAGFGEPKPLFASRLLDYLGIAGFYFPWTGEANYNRGTPASSLPQVVAHEMAHQRGYAREDEANFMGYLVAMQAPHSYPRYSASVFAQRQLLAELATHDREKARALIRRRRPGVQEDIDAGRAYWEQFAGPVSRAASTANDSYLKSQRVPGGIRSYSRSVQLLIAYARSRGGSLLR